MVKSTSRSRYSPTLPVTLLLRDPAAAWVFCDTEVQDAPTVMGDNKDTVQQVEYQRWHGKEVHAAMASQWLLRKAIHSFADSGSLTPFASIAEHCA
jgi:hypothetical protein